MKAEPPAPPCRDDVVVENGAAAPKSCISPLEMRITSAAGGLLPTRKTSTATKTTFNQPPIRLYSTEETNSREETNLWTSIPSTWYDSSFRRSKLFAASSCRTTIKTKSRRNRMFDPGGSQGHLRACLFLRTWGALFCSVFGGSMIQGSKSCRRRRQTAYAIRIAVNRFFLGYGLSSKVGPSRAARGYRS